MQNITGIDRRLYLACLGSLYVFLSVVTAASTEGEMAALTLFDLSIEELMKIEIVLPGSLTETNPLKVPASVTVITADDIARTPARNLLDLLEIYVPGFIYMNHSVGPVPGIRGVLVDRPYKFLVNVNGMNVNIKSHYGARLELVNWDMNDIARIEVIRGPGSVTYGPGAIGGVINITTKTAQNAPGVGLGGAFWDKYNSIGQYLSYGLSTDAYDLYTYFSVVHTDGVKPDLFSVDASSSGYLGSPGAPFGGRPPQTYYSDFYNEPQMKAHVDLQLKNNWRLWMRYGTSSSALIQSSAIQYEFDGKFKDFRQTRYRYYQFTLENQSSLTDTLSLKSTFGVSSIDVHNVEKFETSLIPDNHKDSLRNIGWIWSENEYFSRFMLNYDPDDDKIKAALGFELSYDTIGPAWGKNKDNGLRMSDGIISGPSSEAYGGGTRQVNEFSPKYFAVGSGWETWSHAFLGEVNAQLTPRNTAVLSARVDKHSYTDYMFSPRAAWIHELDKKEFLKFIAQRSVRMNTQEELYMSRKMNEDNIPEKLDTLEFIYAIQPTDLLSFQASLFHNRNSVIAWDWNERRSAPVGTLKTIGIEFEADYRTDNYTIGANHSFVKQLDWKLADGITASGISYSDYYAVDGDVVMTSQGNDLNNWPSHATKLYGNLKLGDGRMTLHGDMRVLWGFEGMQDGLDMLDEAGGDADAIAHSRRQNAYETEITANLSLTCHLSKSSELTFFVQNIPVLGDNKRYSYSSGFKRGYPDKTSWIEEPTVFGVRYHVRF
jgi:outer membrane receptor protein involved in Fe transport